MQDQGSYTEVTINAPLHPVLDLLFGKQKVLTFHARASEIIGTIPLVSYIFNNLLEACLI